MSFLAASAKGEDASGSEAQGAEEAYEKMFPKIGRDFVSRRDFVNIMQRILFLLERPEAFMIDLEEDSGARDLAVQYKDLLDTGKDGSKIFKDLINLDED